METQDKSQPRASLDEKPPLERHVDNDQRPSVENTPPLDDGSTTPDENLEEAAKEETAKEEKEWEYINGMKLALVIMAVVLACFLMLLDNSIISTAIPRITSDFNSLNDIGWYGSAYLLASCALQPLAGKIYNQFSTKYSFMAFLALFELGSLLCGVAQSSKMLIVGRAVAGLGGSGLQNGALTIISACVPLQKRAAYLGFMMAFIQLGILLGPLVGGLLTEYTTWRWCFYINLPIGGIALLFILFIHVPERRVKQTTKRTFRSIFESLDIPGFCLFAPAAIQFLLALEWGGTTYRWDSATVIGLFCGSAATLAVFVVWEHHRGDTAMIPLSMLKQRVVWSSCLTMFFTFSNMMIVTYYLAVYFQAVKGDSPTMSGVSTLPTILSQMIFAVTSGVLVGRLGYYLPWSIACGAVASVSSGLLSTLTPTSTMGMWIGYQIIGGFARGCGIQMPIIAIQNNLKAEQSSIAMALVVFSQTFGGALFLSFAQTTFSNGLTDALHQFAPQVDPEAVIHAGATGFRDIVAENSVQGVILAYNQAISHVFYVGVGAGVGAFICCWGMGWKSIKKPKVVAPEA